MLFRIVKAGVLLGLTAGLLLAAGFLFLYLTTDIPEPKSEAVAQSTVFAYSDGTELTRGGEYNRVVVPLSKVSKHVVYAVLAAENRDFYTEPGISIKGIGRALITDIRKGEIAQGGSTITQQYAKNAYLTHKRTADRKVRELVLAIKLDRTRSKNEILEDYLNTIYFGRGAYGVETAAETYFGKQAAELDASEAAVLAASIASPARFDPTNHPQAARERWKYVTGGMLKQGWLSEAERTSLKYPDVRVPSKDTRRLGGQKGYIVAEARRELAALGYDEDRLALGGYRVVLTLDKKAQNAAAAAVEAVLKSPDTDPLVSLVAVKPADGAVVAMYGGRDYTATREASQLNTATQVVRQPGSSFKPYVLAAALEQGTSLGAVYDGRSPLRIPGYPKPVSNFGNDQCPQCDLVTATARSVNTVYVPLAIQTGPRAVAEMAYRVGVSDKMVLQDRASGQVGAGISLGIYGVRPLDQAVGYATFASGGTAAKPYLVKEVVDGYGEVLYRAKSRTATALEQDVAGDMNTALTAVVERGSGQRAKVPGWQVAGKTGTTQDNTDAWFVGYTAKLSAAVWMGHASEQDKLLDVSGVRAVTGGSLPAMVWQKFMAAALSGQQPVPLPTRKAPVAVAPSVEPEPMPTDEQEPTPQPSGDGEEPGDAPDPDSSPDPQLPTDPAPSPSPTSLAPPLPPILEPRTSPVRAG